MSVSTAHELFGGTKDAGNVIDRYAELQEDRCAGVSQDVRRHICSQSGKFACSPPGSTLLSYRLARIFNDVSCREPAPTGGGVGATVVGSG
jgi:hypothetical protein